STRGQAAGGTESGAQPWIVVGVDHSPAAQRAAGWAAELAPLLGARVSAVHGLGLLVPLRGELVPGHAHRDEIQALAEQEWCAPLADAGVDFRVRVREQPAIDAVVDEIAERAERPAGSGGHAGPRTCPTTRPWAAR